MHSAQMGTTYREQSMLLDLNVMLVVLSAFGQRMPRSMVLAPNDVVASVLVSFAEELVTGSSVELALFAVSAISELISTVVCSSNGLV